MSHNGTIGYVTYPRFSCNVYVIAAERKYIAIALVKLSSSILAKVCDEYVDNQCKVLPVNKKLNGKAAWDSQFKELPRANSSEDERSWNMPVTNLTGGVHQAHFRCPNCGHLEANNCNVFLQWCSGKEAELQCLL